MLVQGKGNVIWNVQAVNPHCKRDLRSSGMLRSMDWWFSTNASGQYIGTIFKGPIIYLDTSVTNYGSTLRNIPEGSRFQLDRGGSLKSRTHWAVDGNAENKMSNSFHFVTSKQRSATFYRCTVHFDIYRFHTPKNALSIKLAKVLNFTLSIKSTCSYILSQ